MTQANKNCEKRVVFDEDEDVHEVEVEVENREGRWYTPQEMNELRASCCHDEEMAEVSNDDQPHQASNVPISQPIPFFFNEARLQAQKTFVKSILEQQDEHKTYGIQDPRGLYQFSKSLSKTSKKRALYDAQLLARNCQQENVVTSKQLVSCIDSVLDILDIPMPLD